MENEDLIKEYVIGGGELFKVTKIDKFRSCEICTIYCERGGKSQSFYMSLENNELFYRKDLHPVSHITDKGLTAYIIDRVQSFVLNLDYSLNISNSVLTKLKIKNHVIEKSN